MTFKLRFQEAKIEHWTARYEMSSDFTAESEIAPVARKRGHLLWSEFVAIARWKPSHAVLGQIDPDIVEAITRAALQSKNESVKINTLRALRGVSWPTASVILHFCDRRPYPILDFRALWSLGYGTPPPYTLHFWLSYRDFVCDLADRTGHSMRMVDRALWQYSKERQKR